MRKKFGLAFKILIIHYFVLLSPFDLHIPVVEHDRDGLVEGVHRHRLAVHRHISRQREFSNCNPDYGIYQHIKIFKTDDWKTQGAFPRPHSSSKRRGGR
jgi:hypothetical protein